MTVTIDPILIGRYDNDPDTALNDTARSGAAKINANLSALAAAVNAFTGGDVVDDLTPQLGGDLDVNGQKIVSVSNGNIDIEPNGTGNVLLGNFTFNADATIGAGQDNYVLTYDHATGLWNPEAVPAAGLSNVSEDTTPSLGGPLDADGYDINDAGVIFLREQASAEADVSGQGQFWVQTATPNVPMFTDDAGTDFNLLQDIFTTDITTVANQNYVLWYDAPFAGAVTMVRTESVSGTCTLTGKINTTALGGTANSVSSSAQEQAHSTTNTFSKGDKLQFTISSNSTCLNLAAAFYITRTA